MAAASDKIGNTIFLIYLRFVVFNELFLFWQTNTALRIYAELEIAKWLLHGTQERSTEIVDDAVQMLHGLVDTVHHDLDQTLSHNTMPVMAVDEVEAMLDRDRRA